MSKRKNITKKIRFEVFKRDKFTCQYCGRFAPEVVLNIDHIEPVSKGGTNDITNLLTACFGCNSGKSNRILSDNEVMKKKTAQLKLLEEKRQQLEMIYKWQKELLKLDEYNLDQLEDIWNDLTGYRWTDSGRKDIKKLLLKYDIAEIIECMKLSENQYFSLDEHQETISKAHMMIERIAVSRAKHEDKPYLKDLYYVRGILKNRFNNMVGWKAMNLLEGCYLAGVSIDILKSIASNVRSWTEWQKEMNFHLGD